MKQRKLVIEALVFEKGKAYGYQEYLFNLLEYFYRHRADLDFSDIVIVCLDSQKQHFCRFADKFSIYTCTCSSLAKRLWQQTFLPVTMKLQKEDVILFTGNYSSLIKRCHHVLVIHDLLFKRKQWLPRRLMRWQREIYLPLSVRLADRIIGISHFTVEDTKHFYPKSKGKISAIYNYFNFQKFLPYPKVERGNNFISIASTAFHKNTVTVLKAFHQYCLNEGTYDLIFVGAILEGTELDAYYRSMEPVFQQRVKVYYKIDNHTLAQLYSQSKAYVSASLFEGLGMPIVEAMFFNLPVILTDDNVFREVSQNRGTYFDPYHPDELAEILIQFEHSSHELANTSELIKDVFSEENTSGKYVELLNGFALNKYNLQIGGG